MMDEHEQCKIDEDELRAEIDALRALRATRAPEGLRERIADILLLWIDGELAPRAIAEGGSVSAFTIADRILALLEGGE